MRRIPTDSDVFSPSKRSWVMSRIRSESDLEREFRSHCWRAGLRGWRVHRKVLGVRGDLVFGRARVVVFLDGCFWHGCPRCYQRPRANAAFWRRKLVVNQTRDRRQSARLRAAGWEVIRIWECDLLRRSAGGIRTVTIAVRSKRRAG
ncbi:MAG: DNA mismatch endonuclease Vsr [Planctomycetes bacterium]|nr:DNA mismatch endonuclease Vsr [Planctomycetota bacterium]